MVDPLRTALSWLPDAEVGSLNEHGELVYIESLVLQDQEPGFNCSGFAKWVADGIYGTLRDRYLSIDVLKEKHLGSRGNGFSLPLEDERDPYFGLDWTRNLARELARLDGPVSESPEAFDVRSASPLEYIEDVGFPVMELEFALYFLAREDPGTFYFASVNRSFGTEPVLRQHTHVVVLFPYFDELGEFRVSVMERNVETSLASLRQRYGDDYIHLTRAAARPEFDPPRF